MRELVIGVTVVLAIGMFAAYLICVLVCILLDEIPWPLSAVAKTRREYRKFCGHNSVRMKYDTVKKLYAVNPDRFGLNRDAECVGDTCFSYFTMYGLRYSTKDDCKWCATGSEDIDFLRVDLSFIDWRRFERDRKKHEKKQEKISGAERKSREQVENSEKLERLLSVAKSDIEALMKVAESEIGDAKSRMDKITKGDGGRDGQSTRDTGDA